MIQTTTFAKLALVAATAGAMALPAAAQAHDRRGENALIGGLLGAAAGGLIGGDATGALVGAGAGAFLGVATTSSHRGRDYRGGDGYGYQRYQGYGPADPGYGYSRYSTAYGYRDDQNRRGRFERHAYDRGAYGGEGRERDQGDRGYGYGR